MYKWKKIYVKIFFNENLTVEEREFFISLILICDNHGRFYADPQMIKDFCYKKHDEMTENKIWNLLQKLQEKNFIIIYKVKEKKFLYILNYLKYNPLYYNSKSEFPEPPQKEIEEKERESYKELELDKNEQLNLIQNLIEKYPVKKSNYQKELSGEVLQKKIKTMKDYQSCELAIESYKNFVEFLRLKFQFVSFLTPNIFFNNYEKFINSFEQLLEHYKEKEKNEKMLTEKIKNLEQKFNVEKIDEIIKTIKEEK